MARTARERKTEFIGIPLDRQSKRRIVRLAKARGARQTEMVRQYVMECVERDEWRYALRPDEAAAK